MDIIKIVGRDRLTSQNSGVTYGELVERMHNSFLDGIKSQKTLKEIKGTLRVLQEFEEDLRRVKRELNAIAEEV